MINHFLSLYSLMDLLPAELPTLLFAQRFLLTVSLSSPLNTGIPLPFTRVPPLSIVRKLIDGEFHSKCIPISCHYCRDGSACMSYTLEKDDTSDELVQKWVPYKAMDFEKDDMPLRQEQLSLRIRECQQTLNFLFKLNEGNDVGQILHSTLNLGLFKVQLLLPICFCFSPIE